ncbi:MAG: hypothetical protein KIC49_11700 [Pseudomonas fluorescens]|nr:hypothetical protein [Pseudomonas fluorescens]
MPVTRNTPYQQITPAGEAGACLEVRYVYPPPQRIKRNDLSRRRIRKRVLRAFKSSFRLKGGQIESAWLSTPGTLVFSLGEWRGHYNAKNEWVAL